MNRVRAVLLDAAQELLSSGWCQGEYVNDLDQHCLVGALQVATGADTSLLFDAKAAVLHELGDSIISWNDEQGRQADEVIALLYRTADSVAS